jgi:hypothetical protein
MPKCDRCGAVNKKVFNYFFRGVEELCKDCADTWVSVYENRLFSVTSAPDVNQIWAKFMAREIPAKRGRRAS